MRKTTLGHELRALKGTDKEDQLKNGWEANRLKVVCSKMTMIVLLNLGREICPNI